MATTKKKTTRKTVKRSTKKKGTGKTTKRSPKKRATKTIRF
jgi:hypothetical protein